MLAPEDDVRCFRMLVLPCVVHVHDASPPRPPSHTLPHFRQAMDSTCDGSGGSRLVRRSFTKASKAVICTTANPELASICGAPKYEITEFTDGGRARGGARGERIRHLKRGCL